MHTHKSTYSHWTPSHVTGVCVFNIFFAANTFDNQIQERTITRNGRIRNGNQNIIGKIITTTTTTTALLLRYKLCDVFYDFDILSKEKDEEHNKEKKKTHDPIIQWESENKSFVRMNFIESNEPNESHKHCLQPRLIVSQWNHSLLFVSIAIYFLFFCVLCVRFGFCFGIDTKPHSDK